MRSTSMAGAVPSTDGLIRKPSFSPSGLRSSRARTPNSRCWCQYTGMTDAGLAHGCARALEPERAVHAAGGPDEAPEPPGDRDGDAVEQHAAAGQACDCRASPCGTGCCAVGLLGRRGGSLIRADYTNAPPSRVRTLTSSPDSVPAPDLRGLGRHPGLQRAGQRPAAGAGDPRRARRPLRFETIFVDDGSTDGTAAAVRSAARRRHAAGPADPPLGALGPERRRRDRRARRARPVDRDARRRRPERSGRHPEAARRAAQARPRRGCGS